MKSRLKGWQRALIAIAGLALAAAIFLPIWRIELSAPQYPEGLMLQIYANKLAGDVDIVNGLNHYIGMRTLHADDFMEFTYLPFIIGFYALLCFVAAFVGRLNFLYVVFGFFVLFGVIAMFDFWHWEYNYGHNLSDTAPIKVPGMTYQPPLIGYKQLLNFGAYSIPDLGGWLMALAGVLLALCAFFGWRDGRKVAVRAATLFAVMFALSSCNNGPVPIVAGTDNCDYCKMSVADARFGAEVLSKKGKAWKFDDVHCLIAFIKEGRVKNEDIQEVYFTRFDGKNELMPSTAALLMYSETLRTPMGSNITAFADRGSFDAAKQKFIGKEVTWKELKP